ncbi:MAG: hypothetical protein RL060_2171 [Bacteroidota bacterium]
MQTHFSYANIMEMEQRQRAVFINSLGGFKSVCLIGTKSKSNETNLAIFNSLVHIGANPPLIGFVVRPDSAERHTLHNIIETGYYTINHLNEHIYTQAHQTAARYPQNVSEFSATGLKEQYQDGFHAPYVFASPIKLGVVFKEKIDFSINSTIFIIGEIQDIYVPNNCLGSDGFVDLETAGTITCSGLDSYHKTQRLHRLCYAKPDAPIKIIS